MNGNLNMMNIPSDMSINMGNYGGSDHNDFTAMIHGQNMNGGTLSQQSHSSQHQPQPSQAPHQVQPQVQQQIQSQLQQQVQPQMQQLHNQSQNPQQPALQHSSPHLMQAQHPVQQQAQSRIPRKVAASQQQVRLQPQFQVQNNARPQTQAHTRTMFNHNGANIPANQAFSNYPIPPNPQVNGNINGQMNAMVQQRMIAQQMQQGNNRAANLQGNHNFQQMNGNNSQAASNKFSALSSSNSASAASSGPGSVMNSANVLGGINPAFNNRNEMANSAYPPQFNPQLQAQFQTAKKVNGSQAQKTIPQQQPTPQIQQRPSPHPQAQPKSISVPQVPVVSHQIPGGQTVGSNSSVAKFQDQELVQSELNSKVFKKTLGNAAVMRLLELVESISNEHLENLMNIEYWNRLVKLHASKNAIFRFTVPSSSKETNLTSHDFIHGFNGSSANEDFVNIYSNDNDPGSSSMSFDLGKQNNPNANRIFELTSSSMPRFLLSNLLAGNLSKFNLALLGLIPSVTGTGMILVNSSVNLHFNYMDGSSSIVKGSCKFLLNREFKIEWCTFETLSKQESIGLGSLESQWKAFKEYHQNDYNEQNKDFIDVLFCQCEAIRVKDNFGFHEDAMRVLQLGNQMRHLDALMGFSSTNNITSPLHALDLFVNNANQSQQVNQQKPGFGHNSPGKRMQDEQAASLKRRTSAAGSNVGSPLITDPLNGPNKRRK